MGVRYFLSEIDQNKKSEDIGELIYLKETELGGRAYRQWFFSKGGRFRKNKVTVINQIDSEWTRRQEGQLAAIFGGQHIIYTEINEKRQKGEFTHIFGKVLKIKMKR